MEKEKKKSIIILLFYSLPKKLDPALFYEI